MHSIYETSLRNATLKEDKVKLYGLNRLSYTRATLVTTIVNNFARLH